MQVTRKSEIHVQRPKIVQMFGTNECLRTAENPVVMDVYKRSKNFVFHETHVCLRCRECDQLLPATAHNFPEDSRYRAGLENHCRDCKAAYMRRYRRRHA